MNSLAMIVSLGGGIAAMATVFFGVRVAETTRRNWLGAIVGIVAFVTVAVASSSLVDAFPDLKWRVDLLNSDDGYGDGWGR